jgi:hypothetical protein
MPTPLAMDVMGPIDEHSGSGAMRQMLVKSPKAPMIADGKAGQGPAAARRGVSSIRSRKSSGRTSGWCRCGVVKGDVGRNRTWFRFDCRQRCKGCARIQRCWLGSCRSMAGNFELQAKWRWGSRANTSNYLLLSESGGQRKWHASING